MYSIPVGVMWRVGGYRRKGGVQRLTIDCCDRGNCAETYVLIHAEKRIALD
jgi:hypothetical protein